jgi:hypothetical protein
MRFRACESRSGFGRVRIRGVFVGLRGCGGSGLEGDGEAEIFELRDQTTRASLGVLSVGEVVLAEVLVHLAGTEQVPDEFDQRVRDGDGRLVRPAAARDLAVLGGEVAVLGARGGPGGFDERAAQPLVAGGGRDGTVLSGGS